VLKRTCCVAEVDLLALVDAHVRFAVPAFEPRGGLGDVDVQCSDVAFEDGRVAEAGHVEMARPWVGVVCAFGTFVEGLCGKRG